MSHGNNKNDRRRFRVQFPPGSMLKAIINGLEYDVVEVAELSIVVTAKNVLNQGRICVGTITWSDGRHQEFTGNTGRLSDLGRVIDEIRGISVQEILREQRRLLRKFPRLKGECIDDVQPRIFDSDAD